MLNDENKKSFKFLKFMFEQNMTHSRHVEYERLTFMGLYLVFVAGVICFLMEEGNSFKNFLCSIMIGISVINLYLSNRWQSVFEQHTNKAKEIYDLMINENDNEDNLNSNEYLYLFNPVLDEEHGKYRTKTLFKYFNYLTILTFIIIFVRNL